MNYYYYYKMIPSFRLCFLGRNVTNAPLLTQRFLFPPKQLLVEFCRFVETETETELDTTFDKRKANILRREAFLTASNLRFGLIKNINNAKGISAFSNSKEREVFSRNFFQALAQHPPEEIIKTMKMLLITNNRPVFVIKTLCDVLLTKQKHLFNEWECSSLLYYLSKLQFRHEPVIELMIENLKNLPNSFKNPKISNSVLLSMMALRFRNCELLEMIVKSVLSQPEDLKSHFTALMSLAVLNYSTPYLDELIKPLTQMEEIDFEQTKHYVSFLWSCVLIGKHNSVAEHHLQNVLSNNFLEKLDYDGNDLQMGIKLKLLQINSATSLMPSYAGPFLHSLAQYKYLCPPLSKQKSVFLKSVSDSIIYVLGKKGYLGSVMDTGRGTFLDVGCEVNSENSTNVLSKKVENVKLGIMLLNFNDICNDGTITGIQAYNLKILEHLGYKMIIIKHSDYPLRGKLSEKITFLRDRIKNAIEGTEDVKELKEKASKSA